MPPHRHRAQQRLPLLITTIHTIPINVGGCPRQHITRIGCTISQIELRALDRFCPEAQYTTVWLPHDPPSDAQRDQFWHDLKGSIDHGYGVAMNWVSPANNPPRPVHGSTKVPNFYGKSTIYHYISAVGYAEENGQRFVAIGDPGGAPNEYWVTLEQCVILMAPKGYVWAAAFKPEPPKVEAPPHTAPQAPVVAPSVQSEPIKAVGQGVEWSAFLGEPAAILEVLRSALSSDPAVKGRAIRVLKVVPKDALQEVALQVRGS